ncbi:MAG: hypothetical protein V7603_5160 [Micromonosporaceae bacterium]
MSTIITVPPAVDGSSGSWCRTVSGFREHGTGGDVLDGEWLSAGDTVTVPVGTIIITVDKTTTGWDYHYKTGVRYAVQTADVAIYTATESGLSLEWSRHFKNAKSACGATTVKKLASLLAQHPPTGPTPVEVKEEAQRPNRRPEDCRWCRVRVPAGLGHLVGHGPQATVEHWQTCPPRPVISGTPCTLCGVTVIAGSWDTQAQQVMVREGEGRWETRHATRVTCETSRPESYEEQQERLEARRIAEAGEREAARRAAGKKAAKAAERAAAKAEKEKAEHDAGHHHPAMGGAPVRGRRRRDRVRRL